MKDTVPLVSRILISLIFLGGVVGKLLDPSGTIAYMESFGLPLASIGLWIAAIIELAGALGLILGYKTRWASWGLIVYVAIATLIFHTKLGDPLQQIMFFKNLAIIGGLLMVGWHGPGAVSLDERS